MFFVQRIIIILFAAILTAGCAGLEIRENALAGKGDMLSIHYTCKTLSNKLVDTTYPDVIEDKTVKTSQAFKTLIKPGPVNIAAGEKNPLQTEGVVKRFRPELLTLISHSLVGKKIGEKYLVKVESGVPEGLKPFSRYIKTKRKRTSSVIRKGSIKYFRQAKHRDPIAGEVVERDDGRKIKIIGVEEEKYTYEILLDSLSIDSPWGPANVKRKNRELNMVIDAEVGTLVMMNGNMGKIIKVTDEDIIVDYGYPLGEECLLCTIEIVERMSKEK